MQSWYIFNSRSKVDHSLRLPETLKNPLPSVLVAFMRSSTPKGITIKQLVNFYFGYKNNPNDVSNTKKKQFFSCNVVVNVNTDRYPCRPASLQHHWLAWHHRTSCLSRVRSKIGVILFKTCCWLHFVKNAFCREIWSNSTTVTFLFPIWNKLFWIIYPMDIFEIRCFFIAIAVLALLFVIFLRKEWNYMELYRGVESESHGWMDQWITTV